MVYNFKDFENTEISVQNPFVCMMVEFVSYNKTSKTAVCSLQDDSNTIIVGFVYNKFAELLSDRHVQNRLPFKISIITGRIQSIGNALTFEIYQCIYEKDFLINSSSLASHSYCEMATYLQSHIHAYSPFNPSQIFGMVYHDYLMYVFEDKDLLNIPIGDPQIPIKVKTAFQQAIYRNWRPLAAFNVNAEEYLNYFLEYYGEKEVNFIHYELEKLRNYGDDYLFQAEVMARSRCFGLQGRVDRILWNRSKNSFTLYETKTGRTSFASENTAKFQLIAYSVIFNEYYTKELEELLLEYPRNDLQDRLKLIEFDENQILRLINMRNQIWAISIGRRPDDGPFKKCSSKCFQKDTCSFYCLRSFLTKNCIDCDRCNYHPILFNQQEFEEFRRMNVYYDWFYQFLEMEYLNNQDLLLELGLPAKDREALGNCFADVVITDINRTKNKQEEQTSTQSDKFWITFSHSPTTPTSVSFINTRINTSDYVLLTPQNYHPLTLQSIPGTIFEFQNHFVTMEVSSDYYSIVSAYLQNEVFRIDIITSNSIINTQKSTLDAFLRLPYLMGNENLKRIRKYLVNLNLKENEDSINIDLKLRKELEHQYNDNQMRAIQRAIQFNDILLIQGPPGSGKTTVITEIVKQIVRKLQTIPNFVQRERPKFKATEPEIEVNTSDIYEESDELEPTLPKQNENKNNPPEYEFENLITSKKILLTAYTNRAVDNLAEMLIKKYPNIDVLRIGSELSISNTVKAKSLEIKSKKEITYANGQKIESFSPKIAYDLVKNATVIATTCLGANSVVLQNVEFEYVVIDEAGQVIEPAALIPLLKAKRILLVGDDAQLPPISVKEQNPLLDSNYFADKNYLERFHDTILKYQGGSKSIATRKEIFLKELNELGIQPSDTLSTSLFQRLKRKLKNSANFVLLTEQYRMHESICDFISQEFYEKKLVPGTIDGNNIGKLTLSSFYSTHSIHLSTKRADTGSFEGLYQITMSPDRPMVYLDTKKIHPTDSKLDARFDEMTSKFNDREAELLISLISKLIADYFASHPQPNESDVKLFLANVGVITPYRAQVRLLRSKLYDHFSKNKKYQDFVSKYILIDTVDKFQGKESEIIFISLVDSNPNKELSSLYSELRRMNVSITRAKTKLILIGNSEMFATKQVKKSKTILDFFNSPTDRSEQLSYDSNNNHTTHLKNSAETHQFFIHLLEYIQKQKGYVILNDKMIHNMEP